MGWLFFVPMACCVPKKKNLVLFLGRFGGDFCDNIKYFYLYTHLAQKNNIEYYFLTEKKRVYELLKSHNLPVLYHPTLRSFWIMLRANIIIAASTAWIKKCKYDLLFKAKKVQIFHGLALKQVELSIPRKRDYNNTRTGRLDNAIRGRFPVYDLMVSTSEFFTKHLFENSFRYSRLIEAGFPRNDYFFTNKMDEVALLESDMQALEKIRRHKELGRKIIVYAPTFRDTGGDAIEDKALDIDILSEFATRNKLVFVFKFHLSGDAMHKIRECDAIIRYESSKDIQPLMKTADAVITDYSSVYLDFLLLDRPTFFFPYDYEKYISQDRSLLFDYDWIITGPKCTTQAQLERAIEISLVDGNDEYAEKRKEIRDTAHKYPNGNSSKRIWEYINEHFIES